MESLTLQPIARVDGTINLPGSKSVSNRALLLAALANGTTVLTNLLDSDDVRHMLNALNVLGISYTLSADRTRCEIIGNGVPPCWYRERPLREIQASIESRCCQGNFWRS